MLETQDTREIPTNISQMFWQENGILCSGQIVKINERLLIPTSFRILGRVDHDLPGFHSNPNLIFTKRIKGFLEERISIGVDTRNILKSFDRTQFKLRFNRAQFFEASIMIGYGENS